ncbi:hypothetical protein RIF29_29676 [Crotalaria pallida]|uniref:Uncharacterized protein n=1 Tax=Crotalaria pallida TaxID=3830 RepID=A0AAN9HW38_CROPI
MSIICSVVKCFSFPQVYEHILPTYFWPFCCLKTSFLQFISKLKHCKTCKFLLIVNFLYLDLCIACLVEHWRIFTLPKYQMV